MPDIFTEFDPSSFTIEAELKQGRVYKIRQGTSTGVLKAEIMEMGMTEHFPGTKNRTDQFGLRERWIEDHGGTPQVKKTIWIAGKIIAWVTERGSVGKIRPLTTAETSTACGRIAAAHDLPVEALVPHTWYLMPCYPNLCTIPDIGGPKVEDKYVGLVTRMLNRDLETAFESLGRLLVCDLFLCNSDRLGPLCENGREPRAVGPQNLFLTWGRPAEEPVRFLAIDFLDPTHEGPYMGPDWQTTAPRLRQDFEGKRMVDNFELLKEGFSKGGARDRAARYALRVFGNCFEPPLPLKEKHFKLLREGMHEARLRLRFFWDDRMFMNATGKNEGWPRGLESRFRALGW